MSNFSKVDLPLFPNLFEEFVSICKEANLKPLDEWTNQFCINTTKNEPRNYLLGAGSLTHDWQNAQLKEENGVKRFVVEERTNALDPKDFDTVCSQFVGTSFEDLFLSVKEKYKVGRIRVMTMDPKTCLSWHTDSTPRLHLPIKTQEGCFMVIEDEVKHLTINNWWLTDTTKPHTAFNSSKESRTHVVIEIL